MGGRGKCMDALPRLARKVSPQFREVSFSETAIELIKRNTSVPLRDIIKSLANGVQVLLSGIELILRDFHGSSSDHEPLSFL